MRPVRAAPVAGQLIKLFFDICLLRCGPQHLPASVALTGLTLVLVTALELVFARVLDEPHPLAWPLAARALAIGFTLSALAYRRVRDRWRQTLSAFFGTGLLLTLVLLPIYYTLSTAPATAPASELIYLAGLALWIWSFVVDAHIFRHALSLSFNHGLAIACIAFALLYSARAIWFRPDIV